MNKFEAARRFLQVYSPNINDHFLDISCLIFKAIHPQKYNSCKGQVYKFAQLGSVQK